VAGIQYEVLVEYARETGVAPELEGRIVEVERGRIDATSET
jgi:hypothetical protein